MKRKIISAFLVLLLCLSMAVMAASAEELLVVDDANLLTDAQERDLNRKLNEISHTYNAQILVITLDSIEGGSIDYFIEYAYDAMELGYGANHDGVLLMVCMDSREYRILSNGFAADAIESYDIDSISEAIVPDLSGGDYAEAFDTFADECAYYLNGHLNGFPFDAGENLVISLIIGIVVGLIVVLILKGQLNSARKQNQASEYVRAGSMNLTVQNDIFLYRHVTRTKRQTSSSSGSSGGTARSKGGGSF